MSHQPGSLYTIDGRRYVDSQAIYNLAGAHEVVPQHDGWRLVVGNGSIRCALVEGRPTLPRQRGTVYALSAENGASLKALRTAWLAQGLIQPAGTFDTWPGEQGAKAGCGCDKTCGCAPCRVKHDHKHGHEDRP